MWQFGILTKNYMSIGAHHHFWHEFFISFAKEIHVLEVKAITRVFSVSGLAFGRAPMAHLRTTELRYGLLIFHSIKCTL
jgi:hypothetical protein